MGSAPGDRVEDRNCVPGLDGALETIASLEVGVIPTNRQLLRLEEPDVIYRTEEEKWRAVVNDLAECQERGQPVLVGTVSIEKSEKLSNMLRKRGRDTISRRRN